MADTESRLARTLNRVLRERSVTVSVAEGTTGGRIGERLVRYQGATAYFKGSVVTYDYPSRTALLGITQSLLQEHGSVSERAAIAMAEAVRERFGTDLGLASTDSTGPTGKNVGVTWLAIADGYTTVTRRIQLQPAGRVALQGAFTAEALRLLLETVEQRS